MGAAAGGAVGLRCNYCHCRCCIGGGCCVAAWSVIRNKKGLRRPLIIYTDIRRAVSHIILLILVMLVLMLVVVLVVVLLVLVVLLVFVMFLLLLL